MSTRILVLGQFVPSILTVDIIAIELRRWLLERGIDPIDAIPVRGPEDHLKLSKPDSPIMVWHRDGLSNKNYTDQVAVPSVRWMILWSNGTPTHLKLINGPQYCAKPFDVVLVDNHKVMHKCPPSEPNRILCPDSRTATA